MKIALATILVLATTTSATAADPLAERDAAVTRIVRTGGKFQFDNKKASRPPIRLDYTFDGRDSKSKPSRFDIASLETLREVHVTLLGPRDLDIEWVTSLPNLVELECRHIRGFSKLSPDAMKGFKTSTQIEILLLSQLPLNDEHIAPIGDLTRLVRLDLSGTNITDKGLASLKTCRSLKAISVLGTEVSGTGFEELKGLSKWKPSNSVANK